MRAVRSRLFLIVFSALPPYSCATASYQCGASETGFVAVAGGSARATVVGSENTWLEIEEIGQNLDLKVAGGSDLGEIRVPPRFGWRVIQARRNLNLDLRRSEPSGPASAARLSLHCSLDESWAEFAWFMKAAKLANGLSIAYDTQVSISELSALARTAPTARTRALGLHLAAQALMDAGRSAAASRMFLRAEEAWRVIGDDGRALAARVGRVEDLRRAGRFAEVLSIVGPPRAGMDDGSYYAIRLINSRCLSLRDIGRDAEAEKCYEWTMPRLDDLDERIEFVNTLQNYAALLMESGRADRAEAYARKALPLATGPNADIVRGRIHLLLMRLALSRGDAVLAIAEANEALDAFVLARNPRWEANGLLQLAAVYRELGAYDEAYDAVRAALSKLSPKDAPARIASALVGLAAIDRLNDRSGDAMAWLDSARKIHAGLGMKSDASADDLAIIRLQMDSDPAFVPDTIDDGEIGDVAVRSERRMVRAEAALRRGDLADARRTIDHIAAQRLSLSDRLRVTRLGVDYWRIAGQQESAEQMRWNGANDIVALASSLRTPILRKLLLRHVDALRTDAFRDLLEHRSTVRGEPASAVDVSDANRMWRWLALGAGFEVVPRAAPASEALAFDDAVANELLVSATDSGRYTQAHARTQRELLALLSHAQTAGPQPSAGAMPGLADIQSALAPDATLVAHVDGGARGALLLVSSSEVRLIAAPPAKRIRSDGAKLQALSSFRTVPAAAIDQGADELSATLFQGVAAGTAPSRLLILAGGALESVPWPLLHWPGQSQPIVETSSVSLVRLGRSKEPHRPERLHLVVASQQQSTQAALPALDAAGAEMDEIKSRLVPLGVTVDEGAGVSRERVFQAMSDAGAWVHVAAHGMADPRRIGYAGFWLDPSSPGSHPVFLSWLDVLGRGVMSDLVVLDACQLGNGGSGADGSFGFASAVSEAGARHVIASLWAVSDAASTAWTRAFYSRLAADAEHDPVEALHAAQRELRRSRMFRHPFYWAGWRSFSRLGSQPTQATASSRDRGRRSVG